MLLEDVQLADPNASDAVSIFVDLKHDAVNLSKDFRETVRGLLTDPLKNQIHRRIQNMTGTYTQNLSGSIRNRIRQYNVVQFRRMYQYVGENGSECIEGYQNGSLSQQQVRQNITWWLNQTGKKAQFNVLV